MPSSSVPRTVGDAEQRLHAEKMARKKTVRDRMLAEKTIEKGLIIVHTGSGKGKSTAAMGLILRALGHGMRVALIQFVKGQWHSGERAILDRFADLLDIHLMGDGFTWETRDLKRDIAAATAAWQQAERCIADPTYELVVLDELNIVLRYGYLDLDAVIAFLTEQRPAATHVVITGRNARPALLEIADLVTEMKLIKHPFQQGIKAQKGIEF